MVGILDIKRVRPQQRSTASPVKRAMQSFHSYGDWLVDQSMSETWNESSTSVGSASPSKGFGHSISSLVKQLEELLECDCSSAVDERDTKIEETAASNNATLRDSCPLSEVPVSPAQNRTLSPTPITAKRKSSSGQLFDVPLTPVVTTTASTTTSSDTKPESSTVLTIAPASCTLPTTITDSDIKQIISNPTSEGAIVEAVGVDCNLELARSVDATAAAIEEFITPVPDHVLEQNPQLPQQAQSQETAIALPALDLIDLLTTCPGSPLPELPSPTAALTETTRAIELSLEASLHSYHATGDAIVDELMEKDVVGKSLHRLDELLTPVPDSEVPVSDVPSPFVSLESFAALPSDKDLAPSTSPALEVEPVPEPAVPKPANRDLPLTNESCSNSLIEVLPKSTGNDVPLTDESFANSVIEDHDSVASLSHHHANADDDTSDLFEDVENTCENEVTVADAADDAAHPRISDLAEQREDTEESSAIRSLNKENESTEVATTPQEKSPLPQHDFEIADFDRRKILGEGQFGQVWLVVEKKTKSPFALKILSKYDMVADDLIGNLVRETAIMKKMHGHPFIAQLVTTFQDDQLVYLLEEFCQGGELFSVMHDLKQFTAYEASFYTNCLARALSDLHERNIVYRDLKPENIVLDVLGYPKLIDFGYAKELVVGERTNTFCGTPRYLAPEIVAGVGHSFAVDDWALGVLIYEFLTGENPFHFEGMDEPGLFDSIQHDDFAQPDIEDKDAMDLITRLLVKDPRKRMSTSEIVDHTWLKQWDFQNDILSCKVKAPWLPTVQNRWDTNCFDNWSGLLEDRTLQQFPKLSAAEAAKFAPLLL